MTNRDWSAAYLGRSFDASAHPCWGLIAAVHRDRLGILLPAYEGDADGLELAEAGGDWPWLPIEAGSEREYDVVILEKASLGTHAGIVTRPGHMLHVVRGVTPRVERYREGLAWGTYAKRFLRHRDRG